MTDPMDQPATKREIALLLERIDTTADTLRAELRGEMRQLASRTEMRQMAETLRAEMRQSANTLRAEMRQIASTLSMELAQHTKTIGEDMRRAVGLVDDRYNHMPARLDAVEGRVDALEPRVQKLETQKRPRSR